MNITILRGVLAGEPRATELPSGSSVCNFDLKAANGDEHHVVPVAWHQPPRRPKLAAGDPVVVVGAVRTRWFRAGDGSRSRTEVVASAVAREGSKGAGRAVGSALDMVVGSGPFG